MKCASQFHRETANENKQFKEIKTLISNSNYSIRSFQGNHCNLCMDVHLKLHVQYL